MNITLVVMACIGPFCTYTTASESFTEVARCERLAPFVIGMTRAGLTSMLGYPRDERTQSAYSCINADDGSVLSAFDSRLSDTRLAVRRD